MTDAKLHSLTRGYVDETLELLGTQDPLAVLAETPAWIAGRTGGLAEAALRRPEAEGRWSLVQVFAHLADTEIVFGWRARLTLTEPRPPITGFNENRWVDRFDYAGADPAATLAAFTAMRQWNLRVWRAATPEEYTTCVGIHSERGEESFERLIRMSAGHDLRHRRQVERILAVVG